MESVAEPSVLPYVPKWILIKRLLPFARWGRPVPVLGQVDRRWGIQALDFVDAVEAAKTATEATALFSKSIEQAGFNAFVMCGLPDAQTEFRNRIIANGWPAGWSSIYLQENLAKDDPVERHCLRTVEPFEWRDAPFDPVHEPRAQMVMHRALDFRMAQGFCVPIHYGDGSGSAVSIAGERPDHGPDVHAAMHLIALYAHHRIRNLLRPLQSDSKRLLSAREREVVRWAADGKTDWEISVILNISERTVHAHMQNSARKLEAVNRVSTIVKALRRGEFSL
jgi:LuxR family quorum sensing-dependent transcriptional regulator